MIYTTYFAKLRSLPKNIVPLAISNSVPPGVQVAQLRKLAPPWKCVTDYKRTGDREAFRQQYFEWLNLLGVEEVVNSLPAGNIALVCYEKDPATCHRSLLAEWLFDKLHLEVQEWGMNNDTVG